MMDIEQILLGQNGRQQENRNDELRELREQLRQGQQERKALMDYLGLTVRDLGGGVLEIVKARPGTGSYVDPIQWMAGDAVEAGVWYWLDETYAGRELPHQALMAGVPNSFYDREYFDFVEVIPDGAE